MERQEKKILETIKKRLDAIEKRVTAQRKQHWEVLLESLRSSGRSIERLLRQARAPRIESDGQIAQRVQRIISQVKKAGGRVSKRQLGEIVASFGMSPNSVGALYGAGYLKSDPSNKDFVVLGNKPVKSGA